MKNDPKELSKQRDQTILASLPNDEFFWFSLLWISCLVLASVIIFWEWTCTVLDSRVLRPKNIDFFFCKLVRRLGSGHGPGMPFSSTLIAWLTRAVAAQLARETEICLQNRTG